MSKSESKRLNLFDFFGFPDRETRDTLDNVFSLKSIHLDSIGSEYWFLDTTFEFYHVWSIHINNYSSHLWLHLLLLYYQYANSPQDFLGIDMFNTPSAAHKILYDTFLEDVSLYLISYFDKHLEMIRSMYNLFPMSRKSWNPSRKTILDAMSKVSKLEDIATEYKTVESSPHFKQIKEVRDNFVHNKSSTYVGMDVSIIAQGVYASGHSEGVSTEKLFISVCGLLREYGQLCGRVNAFILSEIRKYDKNN